MLFLRNQTFMRALNYTDFLKQPDVQQNFNSMYDRQKEYYREKCTTVGFDKEHTELVSIKMAIISTDLYFTDIHKSEDNRK